MVVIFIFGVGLLYTVCLLYSFRTPTNKEILKKCYKLTTQGQEKYLSSIKGIRIQNIENNFARCTIYKNDDVVLLDVTFDKINKKYLQIMLTNYWDVI